MLKITTIQLTYPPVEPKPMGCNLSVTFDSINQRGNLTNGMAMAIVESGTAPFTYLWDNGGQTTAIATGLADSTYNCVVTDANNCVVTGTTTVYYNSCNISGITSSLATYGCLNNGVAGIEMISGGGDYVYSWDTVPVQTGATAIGLSSGTYTVTVTDAWNCTFTANTYVDYYSDELYFNMYSYSQIGSVPNGVACAELYFDLSQTVPNLEEFTFLWNTVPPRNTGCIDRLTAGTYTCVATDGWGCVYTGSTVVDFLPCDLYLTTTGTCNSATAIPHSEISLDCTYHWNTDPVQRTQTATGLELNKTYTVTATDIYGCTASTTVTITNPC